MKSCVTASKCLFSRIVFGVGRVVLILLLAMAASCAVRAQDNYEIEVYGSDTVAPKTLMLETYSNYSAHGSKAMPGTEFSRDGTYPTDHAERETVGLTQGITPWSEVAFYVFTSSNRAQGFQWVGDQIRPRVRAPESWQWPVGVSLAVELGYQRPVFSRDTWSMEIRPIMDKHLGRWYVALNPAVERSFHGPGVHEGLAFIPAAELGFDFTRKVTGNLEYYGSYGKLGDFSPLHEQQHQIFSSVDLNVSPEWEVNFGLGVGLTGSTDHLIVKAIIGRRFNWTGRRPSGSSKGDKGRPQNP